MPALPLYFDRPERLAESLAGVSVLYNTYWVRFNHRHFTFAEAVRNSRTLFHAARQAGVERIVHTSITNPSLDSPLEYFRGKAEVERALQRCGVSAAVLRPAVFFGGDDILINNMAWTLRHLPVFGLFGRGDYRLQPIHVEDFAALAVAAGRQRDNVTINAIGPETFTYRELLRTIGRIIGRPRPLLPLPPLVAYLVATAVGWLVHDKVVTRDEIRGLMGNLLYVDAPPAGATRLTDWAKQNADQLGRRYASELARRRSGKA